MAWIDRFSINAKFSLLLWLPFVLLLLLASYRLLEQGGRFWQDRQLPKAAMLLAEGQRLVLTLQRERQGLLEEGGADAELANHTMRTDMAASRFMAAQARWLGERVPKSEELLAVNALVARLAWMRASWQEGELPQLQLIGFFSQAISALNEFQSRLLAGYRQPELVERAAALAAVAQAQERLRQMPLSPSAALSERLRREFNLHLQHYHARLNAKSVGLGASRAPIALAPMTAGDSDTLADRTQAMGAHLTLQGQLMVQAMHAQWRSSLTQLGWLMVLLLPPLALAWNLCRRVALNLQRRITGLSLAVRALDQQRNYHVRLSAGDQDELDAMIHHLNGVIEDACRMRAELQLGRQWQPLPQDGAHASDPKVTPIRPREGAPVRN